ncbi:MAG TPA: DUF309 domain-containing protein [Actinomycetota bacterium]|nr:DUF309 domain-containing protein [Actinomycetota bacterium]
MAGSRLFNSGAFFETHEEWEEVWRRASGPRREMLRGLIQVSVGYEHLKRGNCYGARSLLRQGARRLAPHWRRRGVRELRAKVMSDLKALEGRDDASLREVRPPKVMCVLTGFALRAPRAAVVVEVPLAP